MTHEQGEKLIALLEQIAADQKAILGACQRAEYQLEQARGAAPVEAKAPAQGKRGKGGRASQG